MKHEYADNGKVRVGVVGDDGKVYKSCWGNDAAAKEAEAKGLAASHCDIWDNGAEYRTPQSPHVNSYIENNELDYSRSDFSVPRGEPRKHHVFWEGWGCLVILAILIFLALAWQASGAPM